MIRVLAFDPALNHTGWVVLQYTETGKGREGIIASDYGVIKPNPKQSLGARLLYNRNELIRLFNVYKPDVIVFEEVFAGKNALTSARLNNVKGVFIVTAYELTGTDPFFVNARKARSCLGFKNNKRDPYEFFSSALNLPEDFLKGNDITDAYTVGYWYILEQRDACVDKTVVNSKGRKK